MSSILDGAKRIAAIFTLAAAAAVSGCAGIPQNQATALGTLAGAGVGAHFGGGLGAAVGAAVGGGATYILHDPCTRKTTETTTTDGNGPAVVKKTETKNCTYGGR